MKASVEKALTGEVPAGSNGERTFTFRFGADQAVFAGHFPGKPILPGVFQIEMARRAAEAALEQSFSIAKIIKSKFSRVIEPEETLELVLTCETSDGRVRARARFSVGGEKAGETVLDLAEDGG